MTGPTRLLRRRLLRRACAVLAAALACTTLARPLPAAADTLVLQGGTRLEGVVLARTGEGPAATLRVLLPAGQELVLAAADVQQVLPDAEAPQGEQVVRFRSGQGAPEGLQVALLHLVHEASGRRVDLVGAVHIADMAYYREVQRLLEAADLVLYELVKPEGVDDVEAQPADAGEHPLRDFQRRMAGWFGFAHQMEGIAYDRPHFVHADMTVEQFMAAAESLGSTPLTRMLGLPGRAPAAAGTAPGTGPGQGSGPAGSAPQGSAPQGSAPQGSAPQGSAPSPAGAPAPGPDPALGMQVKLLEGLLRGMGIDDPRRGPGVRRSLKSMLGRMMGSMGPRMGALLGSEASELIVERRNAVALERLAQVPASARSVAIFYGAAHLPDLERRLLAQGYRRAGSRWLLAWDLSAAPAAAPAAPAAPATPASR
ncbi:MAG: hypothetical protein ACKOSS_08580 [Planctomycetia bacterium]